MSVRRPALMISVAVVALVGSLLFLGASAAFAKPGYIPLTSFAPPGGFSEPYGLAVDNSASLFKGDVYVLDQGTDVLYEFSPDGIVLGQVSLPGVRGAQITVDDFPGPHEGDVYVAGGFGIGVVYRFGPGLGSREEVITGLSEPTDVAVDETGNVFVSEFRAGKILEFNSAGEPVDASGVVVGTGENAIVEGLQYELHGKTEVFGPTSFAVDASGAELYVVSNVLFKYELSKGVYVARVEPFVNNVSINSVTVAPSGEVYISQPHFGATREIAVYDSSGELLTTAGFGLLSYEAKGLGLSDESDELYVAEPGSKVVYIFEGGERPETPITEAYGQLDGSSVMLNGTLAAGTTSYYFEYSALGNCRGYYGGGESPLTTTPVEGVGGQHVHAEITELQHFTRYDFCLVATNKYGSTIGPTMSVETGAVEPRVTEVAVSPQTHTANVSAQVNPEGAATKYYVEYGRGVPYETRTAELSAGSGVATGAVTSALTGLEPASTYHFSFVAVNEIGTTHSSDETFTTYALAGGLPDGRVYEMVTPPDNRNADAYAPEEDPNEEMIYTEFPFEASENGDAVEYAGAPSTGGNGSSGGGDVGNEYLASRGPHGGWAQRNITPVGAFIGVHYQAFTSDLSTGFISVGAEAPFTVTSAFQTSRSEAPAYGVLYSHGLGESVYQPLFTAAPPHRAASEFGAYGLGFGQPEPLYAGASVDLHHMLFEANDALTGTAVDGGREENNLYDNFDGQLTLVNVLPDGTTDAGATFGGRPLGTRQPGLDRVISADGSKIFWTDTKSGVNNGVVFVRENGSRTVQVSLGAARFRTASTDGKYAFYTEEEKLWRFDTEDESRTELAGGSPLGVIGTNETGEDGAYVYFVALGVLASNENMAKQRAVEGERNVYVYEPDPVSPGHSRIVFIGTLSFEDENDWSMGPGELSANVTPDGHGLVFISHYNLMSGPPLEESPENVYVYNANDGSLFCASCRPQANGGHLHLNRASGTHTVFNFNVTYTSRWISADGDRVFFDSSAPLVAQDVNGRQDVYEWERDGSGECHEDSGCVYLLSNGFEGSAALVDASTSGDDVFFVTRQRLVPEDNNETVDVYDARVNGVRAVAAPSCSGTACQGVPASAPIFATPSSVTFNGVGNFPPSSAKATVTKKRKTLTRAQKLAKALSTCARKRGRKARAKCEAKAHKLYGARTVGKSGNGRGR
jgi:hypothetical protein